jgi:hypothetical protein
VSRLSSSCKRVSRGLQVLQRRACAVCRDNSLCSSLPTCKTMCILQAASINYNAYIASTVILNIQDAPDYFCAHYPVCSLSMQYFRSICNSADCLLSSTNPSIHLSRCMHEIIQELLIGFLKNLIQENFMKYSQATTVYEARKQA